MYEIVSNQKIKQRAGRVLWMHATPPHQKCGDDQPQQSFDSKEEKSGKPEAF